jgi:hypothetical protein
MSRFENSANSAAAAANLAAAAAANSPKNSESSQSSQSYGITFAFATLTAIVVFVLFMFKNTIPGFLYIYWIGTPIFILLVGFLMALANQAVICGSVSPGPAFFGAISGPLLALFFMAINSIKFFRIPIASAFQPLLVSQSLSTFKNLGKLSNMNSENTTRLVDIRHGTLEVLEEQYPALFGISAAYYIFFAVLFASVIGNTQSITC